MNLPIEPLALVAFVAFGASLPGGVAGYGTGLILLAVVLGLAGFPRGFVAKRLALRMSDGVQTAIHDGAVALGGLLLVAEALR